MLFDIQAEFEAKKAKEKVTNLDGENEVGVSFFKEKNDKFNVQSVTV